MLSRTKTIFVGFAAIAAVIIGTAIVLYISFLHRYDELDRSFIEEGVAQIETSIANRIASLKPKVQDWAAWDDAYQYVRDQNPKFEKDNILPNTFSGLRVDLLAYLSEDLKPVTIAGSEAGKVVHYEISTTPFLAADYPLIVNSELDIAMGIVEFNGHIAIAAAKSITHSDTGGKPIGRVVFARVIDQDMLNIIKTQSNYDMSISDRISTDEPGDQQTHLESFRVRKSQVDLYPKVALVHVPLIDMTGETLGFLNVTVPRKIAVFGRKSARGMLGVMTMLFAVITGILILVLRSAQTRVKFEQVMITNRDLEDRESHLRALIDSVPGYVSWFDKT